MCQTKLLPLFGDGVHDDTTAIQQRINQGACELVLPAPTVCYLISRPLDLPSNFRLVLPRFAEIRLADGANCYMLRNRRPSGALADHRQLREPIADDDYSRNIEICGGIWNMNNSGQAPNPLWKNDTPAPEGFIGFGMLFYAVRGLTLRSMTLKDPTNFAVTLDRVSYFTVEDIDFDYNYGNPVPVNMDGIHCNGNCHFGLIRNLKGACYDDAVALNADEGSDGPITNIEVSGIWAEDCHSAVRLLTGMHRVENIHIHDIYGTYFQYCVGFTKQADRDFTGEFAHISIDRIFAAKAPRHSIYQKDGMGIFALFFIERTTKIRDLSISEFYRTEAENPFPAIDVEPEAIVDALYLTRIATTNQTGQVMPLIRNNGTIGVFSAKNLSLGDDPLLIGSGTIVTQL
ncbi:MAG: hypothetical protein IKU55_03935 [Clostridia bacterium]|nr:hypothetical protein [Clostridia bacterium]